MHQDALEELYRAHYRPALLYVLSLCGDMARAEDVVSQAFEIALMAPDGEVREFRSWLLTVCRNLWLDEVRRERRRHPLPPEELPLAMPEDALASVLAEERSAALYRALGRLPPKQRELIALFYFAGLPLTRIAALTGTTHAAAKTALCRARARLRHIMEEDGYGI